MKLKKINLLILLLLLFAGSTQAQDLSTPLELDPNVKFGKLDNGFTYYIRHNEEPKNRMEMRLAVNAGSVLENDSQQGIAHLMEHMCFNGTKHFEKSAIVDFIESTGVKFGQHLNAYTSFDETVYMLQMPTDRSGLIDSAFLIMEDWAHNVSLESEEIDKERGVVIEEWRLGLGADERMRQEYFPILLKGSKYAERLPIGKKEIIENCPYDTIRKFYHDWYRPDLMAMVVVGDVDPEAMEAKIKEHFSGIENPGTERKRKSFNIPDNKEPLIAIATDEEATYSMAAIFYKHEKDLKTTVGDYRDYLKERLYNGMVNARLQEIMQKPTSPFMYGYTGYGGFFGRTKDAYSSYAMAKPDKIKESIEVMAEENERVERYGFTPSEFERQKQELLRSYEKQFNERDKMKSRSLASEYLYNFLAQEPAPGIEAEFEMAKALVPGITLDEMNKLAEKWITDENIAVLITAPKNEEVIVPTEEEVMTAIKSAQSKDLEPYEDKVSDEPLVGHEIQPGEIVDVRDEPEYEHWTLSNGAEVFIKTTDFKNDEILFRAYSQGGSSLLPDDEVVMSRVFSEVVDQSGAGNFSGIELEKKLAGKIVSLNPYLGDLQQGFSGSTSPKDMETFLELLYIYLTEPRQDKDVFDKTIDNLLNQVKFSMENPRAAFYDSLYKVATSNSPRTIVIPTEAQVKSIQQNQIYSFYDKTFGDVSGFKFFFVGNVDKEALKPLVEKYIGGIPPRNEDLAWRDVEPEFPKGITEVTVHKGKEPQSQVMIMMNGDYDYNFKENLTTKYMIKVLNIRLREKIREDESGTYGIGVSPSLDKYPKPEYTLMISFGCNPDRVDELVAVIMDELKSLKEKGPSEQNMAKARETFLRERETDVKENRYWLNKLEDVAFLDSKLMTDEDYNAAVKAVTAKDVQTAANKYLTLDHYLFGVLKPAEME